MNKFVQKKSNLEVLFLVMLFLAIMSIFLTFVSPLFLILLMPSIGLLIYASYRFKALSTEFKNDYVKEEVKKLIDDAYYDPKRGISKNDILKANINKRSDRYNSEDYLAGKVQGKRFRSCDLHLQDVRSTGKTTTVITVFRGRFFEIEFDKKFEEDVFIYPANLNRFGLTKGLTKIDVESILFNKNFVIYSKSKDSAFYLLKPRFIEKILEFRDKYPKISFGFKDKYAYIAIDTRRDAFDLVMFKRLDESFVKEINNEIKLIEDLINLIE